MTTDSKPTKKRATAYHVFAEVDDHKTPTHRPQYQRVTQEPVVASTRKAAVELAAKGARVWAPAGNEPPEVTAWLAILADEFQLFRHRKETVEVDLWEALPDPPAALRPPGVTGAVSPSAESVAEAAGKP